MRTPLHWRFALWNALLIGFAFVLFGADRRVFVFAAIVLIVTTGGTWRLHRQITLPLGDLVESLQHSAVEGAPMSGIPRGSEEIQLLVAAINDWRASLESRVNTLSEAHFRLESVLRAMDEGVLVFDRERHVIRSNAASARLLDFQSPAHGMSCIEIFRNEDLDQAVAKTLKGNEVDAVELQTGSNRILRALVTPVRGRNDGRVEAAVMVLEDLTEIRRVDRIRRDFVANVSHEFKTPLTSIQGYAETIASESADESVSEFAETIRRNAIYLESLVNDLLVLARFEASRPSLQEELDVRALVDGQIDLRGLSASPGRSKIEVECPPIKVLADPVRLGIAVSNLIDNAITYNRPEGVIRVVGRAERGHLILEVSDQGYGIPQDELPRIFERFYRVDRARTLHVGGTGLGLAIARHAIESQGGTLTVTSHVGTGSTFRVSLPLRTDRADCGEGS